MVELLSISLSEAVGQRAGDENAFHGDGAPGTSGIYPSPSRTTLGNRQAPAGQDFWAPVKDPETANRLRPLTMAAAVSSDHRGAGAMRRPPWGGARLSSRLIRP